MSRPHLVIVGAGPGLGAAVARAFGRDGYTVGLVSRSEQQLAELAESLRSDGVEVAWAAVDVTDGNALRAAVCSLADEPGRVDVLHFNPSRFRQADLLELTPAELAEDVGLGIGALLTALQAARPFMTAGARVTATGSMAADRPWHRAATLGVQKAGLRNLVRSIDARLADEGIRAVSVTVNGTLEEGTRFDPVHVAEAIRVAAARTDDATWTTEVAFDG